MFEYKDQTDINARIRVVMDSIRKLFVIAPEFLERAIHVIEDSENINCHGASMYISGMSDAPPDQVGVWAIKEACRDRMHEVENAPPKSLIVDTEGLYNHSGIRLYDIDGKPLVLHKDGKTGARGDLKLSRLQEAPLGHLAKSFIKKIAITEPLPESLDVECQRCGSCLPPDYNGDRTVPQQTSSEALQQQFLRGIACKPVMEEIRALCPDIEFDTLRSPRGLTLHVEPYLPAEIVSLLNR
ncbi:MAG: hypothetical protein HOG49_16475 [Candidatus Scalindua sp.]|nr:hypothetical protein [Candidatus Scalindua sp.]